MPGKKSRFSIYDTVTMAWFICLLAAFFYSYDFLLRVQPNILVDELMQKFSINAAGVGTLYAAYYWVYTPLQIPAGLVIDRYNIRVVLSFSALLCAAGALMFAKVQSYDLALFARILMGFGSAFAFIGTLKLAAAWLPARHFAAFSGLATTLGTVGALATNVLLPLWISKLGWEATVLLTGYIGVAITVLIAFFIRSRPRKMNPPPREFKSWAHAFQRLWFITKQWEFWLNGLVGCLMFLPITVLAGLWGTSFLEQAFFLPPEHAAIADAVIFIGMSVGGPIAGWASDRINRRKLPLYVGSLGSALLMVSLIYANNLSETMLYSILFFIGFFTGPQVLVFAIGKEISPPRTTGTAAAGTNFLVTMGGLAFAPLVGKLMVVFWDGKLSSTGVPIYSLGAFREALLILPASAIAAFIVLALVPETFGKMRHKSLHRNYK